MSNNAQPPKTKPTPEEDLWAREKVKDLLFGCVLNIKLHRAGICPRLFTEMSDGPDGQFSVSDDLRVYGELVHGIHTPK